MFIIKNKTKIFSIISIIIILIFLEFINLENKFDSKNISMSISNNKIVFEWQILDLLDSKKTINIWENYLTDWKTIYELPIIWGWPRMVKIDLGLLLKYKFYYLINKLFY